LHSPVCLFDFTNPNARISWNRPLIRAIIHEIQIFQHDVRSLIVRVTPAVLPLSGDSLARRGTLTNVWESFPHPGTHSPACDTMSWIFELSRGTPMPRDLILGTAGHIDHGKTALVKALTGIDCDRLPEEKARGITIDIGFASLELGDYRLGIVDVPGHERFVKNMLAGATGVDLALLVVAADDSVMPQTREHLEILKLLGLRHGLVAITKCDLVDETTCEVVELETRELVQGSFLADAPIVRTSAQAQTGILQLKQAIAALCLKVEERNDQEWFRLAIDRSFVVQGHGTVVTGTVMSGRLQVGAEVEWLPRRERVRVRSLQNHGHAVEEVHRGMRAAVNLAGIHHEEVMRGQEIAAPGYLEPSRILTVRLQCPADGKRPVKHRATVRLHIGTAEVMGRVSLLDCDVLEAGHSALGQVFLKEPALATWGQPFIIRGAAATYTLGGGQVLQPVARKIRRRHVEMLEKIERLQADRSEERALAVAWFGGFGGFKLPDLVRGAGVSPDTALETIESLRGSSGLVEVQAGHGQLVLLHPEMVLALEERILALLAGLHEQNPLMSGHELQRIQAQLDYVGDETLVQTVVNRLLESKRLVGDYRRLARADFRPRLSGNQRKLKEKLIEAYRDGAFQPPEPATFVNQAGGNAATIKDLFDVCVAEGFLVQVGGDLYLHADCEAAMRRLIGDRLATGGGLAVAEIRDLLKTTRKYAVPLCEYLDRIGITRREGDLRVLAHPGQTARAPVTLG
jgi:selenocysteine-specific elongation factor